MDPNYIKVVFCEEVSFAAIALLGSVSAYASADVTNDHQKVVPHLYGDNKYLVLSGNGG